MKAKNAFLVYWIRMVLKPLRPIDTANIIKNPNTPNNQPEKNNADFGFKDSSLINVARNQPPEITQSQCFMVSVSSTTADFRLV